VDCTGKPDQGCIEVKAHAGEDLSMAPRRQSQYRPAQVVATLRELDGLDFLYQPT